MNRAGEKEEEQGGIDDCDGTYKHIKTGRSLNLYNL